MEQLGAEVEVEVPCAEGTAHPVRLRFTGWIEFEVVYNPCEELLGPVFARMAGCTHYLHEQFPDNLRHDRVLKIQIIDAMRRVGNPAIPTLLHALGDDDLSVREAACRALGDIGDPQAVPHLVQSLADTDRRVVKAACEALGKIGDTQAVPHLVQSLSSTFSSVQAAACRALGRISDSQALPHLVVALQAQQWWVRVAACLALGQIGDPRAIPVLVQALSDTNGSVRAAACRALGQLDARTSIDNLMELLVDEDAHARCAACIVLGNFRAVQATNRLIVALEDRNPYVRWNAARALGYIGDVRAAIPLIRALGDTYRNVRRAACDALSAIGDLEAVPALSVWAQAGDEAALQALRTLGEAPMPCDEAVARLIVEGHEAVVIRALPYPEVRNAVGIQGNRIIPLLLQAARDGSYAVRRAACILLGQLRASEAFQALTERLRDHNRLVRQAACQALGELGDPQAVPYLSEVLDDTDSYTRQAACYALGMIARNTPLPREAITQLAARLDDSETSVCRTAFTALQYAGAVARDILIERLQNSQSVQVRQSVCRLLQAIRDEEAMQALMHALMEDESRAVRLAAARALVSRGADAVPMLIRTLARADITTLRQICTLFGRFGDAAAVPVLLEQLSHPNDAVRRAACIALGVIGDPQALSALSIWAHAGNDSARRALQQMDCLRSRYRTRFVR
jgi:HEAT repeat protein